jgi:hypothetical protein
MTAGRSAPPDELLARIAADMRPVRPLASPLRRVLMSVPVGLVVFLGLPLYVGLRADASTLGPLLTWGASAAQVSLGVWLLWAGAREARPGRRLSLRLNAAVLVATAAIVAGLTALTFAVSPTTLPGSLLPWSAGSFCYRGSLAVGAPQLFLAGWALGRALPGHPWLAGALFGAGAGLTADATWRLLCPVSDPWHVLVGHGGALVTLTLVGAVGAAVAARRRVSTTRPRLKDTP